MTSALGRQIARRIALTGPIPVAEFMAEALGHPTLGYYRRAMPLGATGDFTTAVWFGNDNYHPMRNMTGGTIPAMTWKEVMSVAERGVEPKPIPGVAAPSRPGAPSTAAGSQTVADLAQSGRLTQRASSVLRDIERLMHDRIEPRPAAGSADAALPPTRLSSSAPSDAVRVR